MKSEGYDDVMDVNCAILVLACGWESGRMGRLLGIGEGAVGDMMHMPIPVEPRKRYVYVVHVPDGPTIDAPFLIDPSGAYFRREGFGGNFVCGISPANVSYSCFKSDRGRRRMMESGGEGRVQNVKTVV